MSDNNWDKMGKAKENDFFRKQNQKALHRIKERENEKPRLSPVTGKEMEQVNLMGVIIDRCPESGGIWLDKGELEEILQSAKESGESKESWADEFFNFLKK